MGTSFLAGLSQRAKRAAKITLPVPSDRNLSRTPYAVPLQPLLGPTGQA